MSNGAPEPQNYNNLAREQGDIQAEMLQRQTLANRPNQSSPFASSGWTMGADGQWTNQVGFTGPLAGASNSAQQQLMQAMSSPLSFSSLPGVSSGDAARQQGIEAAYGQASSRLDPRFARAKEDERTRLLNQGLSEGSEAYNQAMGQLGMQENDAYNQALFSAVGQGQSAGDSIFRQDMARRGMGMEEMLRQRAQPLMELQGMQGLLGQQGFMGAGQGQAPNLLAAAMGYDNARLRGHEAQQQFLSELISAGVQGGAAAGQAIAMCDERAKVDVARLPEEAVPGVPLATFRYAEGMGPPGLHLGVIAQDLEKVYPEAVSERDGMLWVHSDFAPVVLED